MKFNLKMLSLLLWVTQFGFSVLFPICFFLFLGGWLQRRFDTGMWLVIVFGVLGLLTSVSTARSCIRQLRREVEDTGEQKNPPVAFNEHD